MIRNLIYHFLEDQLEFSDFSTSIKCTTSESQDNLRKLPFKRKQREIVKCPFPRIIWYMNKINIIWRYDHHQSLDSKINKTVEHHHQCQHTIGSKTTCSTPTLTPTYFWSLLRMLIVQSRTFIDALTNNCLISTSMQMSNYWALPLMITYDIIESHHR